MLLDFSKIFPTLPALTHYLMHQNRYFFGFYYFYAAA